jgi:hypothetical protein
MNSATIWKRSALAFGGASALVLAAATIAQVQTETTTTTGQATKQVLVERAQVLAVSGNDLVVKMADGSIRHIANVPESARVTVDGKQLGIHDLKPGMTLQRTITTTTVPKVITTTQSVTGRVWHVQPPTSVILTMEDGKNQEFKIPKGQKFNVDGQVVDVWGLKKGMKVTVTKVVEEPLTVVDQQRKLTGQMPPPPTPPPADVPILVVVEEAPLPAAPAAPAVAEAAPAALPGLDDDDSGPTARKTPHHHHSGTAVSAHDLDQAVEQREYEAVVKTSKTGGIQYYVPSRMVVGKPISVQVEIDGANCSSELRKEFQATGGGTLKVITPMQVQLSAPDNPEAFTIQPDPVKSGNLFLPDDGKALWVWTIIPLQGGSEPKKLKIDAYMVFNAKLPSGQPITRLIWSYTAQVPVQVETMRIVSDFIRQNWDKLLALLVPSGAGAALVVWLLSRRNRAGPTEKSSANTVLVEGTVPVEGAVPSEDDSVPRHRSKRTDGSAG